MPTLNSQILKAAPLALALALSYLGAGAHAQGTTRETAVGRTNQRATTVESSAIERTGQDETAALMARTWGLNRDELQRALTLLRGQRAAFSVPNLSPIEALGIHARNPEERRRYAEMMARTHHEDVERVLAWQAEFTAAMQRMYPNEPVISFSDTGDKPEVTPGIAAAAAVPQSAIKPATPRRAKPQVTR